MKMDITSLPIKIRVTDKRKFRIIASLVDQDGFREDLTNARKKIGIYGQLSYPQTAMEMDKKLFESFVNGIINKYQLEPVFKPVIEEMITKWTVSDYNFQTVYPISFKDNTDSEGYSNKKGQMGIGFTSIATNKEILDLVKKMREDNKGQMAYFANGLAVVQLIDTVIPATAKDTKRDRRWYWMHKKNKSYRQIAIHQQKKQPKLGLDDLSNQVKVSINRYKKMLGNNFQK
jgi:hypothetical protein